MSDSPVIAFLNKVTDLILLNLLWILCCLPVVTAGAATTAMYYVCITSIRCGDGYVAKRFFKSFRDNFKQITPIWLCILAIALLFGVNTIFWARIGWPVAKMMQIVNMGLLILFFIYVLWLFPVCAKLSGTTRSLLKNTAAFALGYLPYTVIVLGITGFAVWANLRSVIANSIMLFLGFALLAYVQSFFFYRVFLNHIDEKLDIEDPFEQVRQENNSMEEQNNESQR